MHLMTSSEKTSVALACKALWEIEYNTVTHVYCGTDGRVNTTAPSFSGLYYIIFQNLQFTQEMGSLKVLNLTYDSN